MNWTMPYPWRSRRDSVRRINMSSEPGNESFFCALRPIPRILSLRGRDYARQVPIGEISRRKMVPGAESKGARASGRQAGGDPVEKELAYAETAAGVLLTGVEG